MTPPLGYASYRPETNVDVIYGKAAGSIDVSERLWMIDLLLVTPGVDTNERSTFLRAMALQDSEADVRLRCFRILLPVHPTDELELWKAFLEDPEPEVRNEALSEIGDTLMNRYFAMKKGLVVGEGEIDSALLLGLVRERMQDSSRWIANEALRLFLRHGN